MNEFQYEGHSHAPVAWAVRFSASADQLELLVDNFAGGGGASEGIERAFGRPVDIAINHSPEALTMHAANHPETTHYCESVFEVDPVEVTKGRPVALVWLSPDCKHFSKAKGGTPVNNNIRGLAWVAVRWAATVKPRVIALENVEEFLTWSPVVDGKPCPKRKGETFKEFVAKLESHGYKVEYRLLRASDYGAPTIRKRLFLVARRDNLPIVWPEPTHGDPRTDAVKSGKLKPWRTAAECIDWSLPCPSIFERKRPLKDATLRRIAKGIMKFVVNSDDPFIVPIAHYNGRDTVHSGNEPLRTITAHPKGGSLAVVAPTLMHVTHQGADRTAPVAAPIATVTGAHRGEQALVSATLIQTGYGERPARWRCDDCGYVHEVEPICGCTACGSENDQIPIGGQSPRVPGLDKPLGTVVAGGVKHAQVTAFLAKHYGGHETPGASLDDPLSTVTAVDHHAVVTSHLLKLRNNQFGQSHMEPMPTLTAGGGHVGEVRAFLVKYYSEGGQWQALSDPMHTIPTKDRLGLVTIHGEDYVIVDIGMRMLTPRELARAQSFPDHYILDPIVEQNRGSGEIRGAWSGGKPVSESRSNPKMIRKMVRKGQFKWVKAPLSKSAQVRMIGNSVCPDVAEALLRANFARELDIARAA